MIAGLLGLEPMPRKRALLTLRAVNSVNTVFGAKIAASVMARSPESVIVCAVTAVTLAGTSLTSVASFCAVTITVGNVTVGEWSARRQMRPWPGTHLQGSNDESSRHYDGRLPAVYLSCGLAGPGMRHDWITFAIVFAQSRAPLAEIDRWLNGYRGFGCFLDGLKKTVEGTNQVVLP